MAQVSEFGRKWNAKVPRYSVGRMVGRFHVSKPDTEVAEEVRAVCETAKAGGVGFTPSIINQTVAYALECHHRNQALYRRVFRGF